MGLIQEVQTLNDTNKQLQSEYIRARKEAEKATKKAEQLTKKLEQVKKEKEQKKEYERDLKKAVENDCMQCMKRCFEREGYQKALYHLQLAETRNDILQHISESENEFNYLDNNYERILNKVKKIYENDQKAKNKLLTQQLKEELKKSKTVEIAKKFGYSENKTYTIEEINTLNDKIQLYIKKQQQQEEEQKGNAFLGIFKFIGLIIKWTILVLFGWIYFIFKLLVELSKGC